MPGDIPSWSVDVAVATCPVGKFSGSAWRFHAQRWPGDSAAGSLRVTGRYHRGADRFPTQGAWPALYTALAPHIALGEIVRHTSAIAEFANKRLSRLHIELQAVLDGTNLVAGRLPGSPGFADFCHPGRFDLTHAVAAAARGLGAEALLMPSCTRFAGNNLIVFVDCLRAGSSIVVVDTEDPDLYVDWTAV